MRLPWKVIFFLMSCLISGCKPYRILAFLPFPSNSHHNIFLSLIKVLADRGHQITYYTPIEPSTSHPNITLKLTPNYKTEFLNDLDISNLGKITIPEMSHMLSRTAERFSEQFYGNEQAQEIINSSEKYDAVIMESYFMQEPVSALIHKFGCVGIEISTMGDSAWISEWAGLPYNAAYQVDFKTQLSQDMSLSEKLYNVYAVASTFVVSYFHMIEMKGIMDKYFKYPGWEGRPSFETLLANRSIILVNSDPVLSYPYPTAPHVKNLAGLNLVSNKPLPKDLQTFMDEAENGVIYFSFGSNLNTSEFLRGKKGKSFMNAFAKMPQRVLIKWETNKEKFNIPPNVRTEKWFPQRDILAHKNCILFVTHGGFLSLTETVYYGVPVIGVPFFTDQFKDMVHAQTMGYGLMIKYENITDVSVSWALNEIINEKRYRETAQKTSQMFRQRRHTAQEEAIYWVEHAIKYPNSLTPRSAYMSFWERRIFEVGTFFLLSIASIFFCLSTYLCLSRRAYSTAKKLKVS